VLHLLAAGARIFACLALPGRDEGARMSKGHYVIAAVAIPGPGPRVMRIAAMR